MKLNKKTVLGCLAVALLAITIPAINASSKNQDVVTLSKDNVVLVNEEVSGASVASWLLQVQKLDKEGPADKCIILAVNSPGGEINSGIDLTEGLKGMRRCLKTLTIFSASMAFQLVQQVNGDRLILKNGVLMSHRAKGGMEGEFGGEAPSQIDSRYQFWLSRLRELDQTTVDRTKGKQTLQSYQHSYANEMWRTGEQSVAEGYADKVVTAACDASLSGTTKHTGSFMGMEVKYELSECPLIGGPLKVEMVIPTNTGDVGEKSFLDKGGRFDPYCIREAKTGDLCALDTSLSRQKLDDMRSQFRLNFTAKQRQVVYMNVK